MTTTHRHLRGGRLTRTGVAATLAVVAFAPQVLPGGATMNGGGAVAGFIDYPDPNGLWYVGGCQAATWDLGLTGVAGALDPLNDESAGIAGISATGATDCPLFSSVETGTVTSLSLSSSGVLGDVECPTMTGSYSRTLTLWSIDVTGNCTLNAKSEGVQRLVVTFTGSPTSIGGDFGSFTSFVVAGTVDWPRQVSVHIPNPMP